MEHGTYGGYTSGCRLDCCRDAYREYRRQVHARPIPEDAHGTVRGYTFHGCRNDCCRSARNSYLKEYRKGRTAIIASIEAAQAAEGLSS